MNIEPLFDVIDRQGSRDVPLHEKIEPVFQPQNLLLELGVHPALAQEIGDVATRLLSLNTLVMMRRPEGDERFLFEGRGSYHTDIPITKGRTATVYVKGTGNEDAFNQPAGLFTGFPSQPDNLFFDELVFSQHPRELGTETMRWALMEVINASFIFADVANSLDWKHIEEAIDAGVTIPLNVLHQKELSAYLYALLQRYKATNHDVVDQPALQWLGNTQLGSMSLIVPNRTRIAGGIGSDEGHQQLVERLSNAQTAEATGRTLRMLADMGFCYSMQSSHGQNLYSEGLMVQADNSDLVTLGDYHGDQFKWTRELTVDITAREQRIALLYFQFNRADLLTPIHYPLISDETRITWEEVQGVQNAFWQQILKGLSHPEAIERMVKYMPFLRSEINLAAATLLVDGLDNTEWERMAQQKRTVLARFEDDYGVLDEYERKIIANLSDQSDVWLLRALSDENKFRSNPLINSLITGDFSFMEGDPWLSRIVQLENAIETIEDKLVRDEILELCAATVNDRNVTLHAFGQEGNIFTRFEGRHLDLITDLVTSGRFNDALSVLHTLNASSTNHFTNWYGLQGGHEVLEDYYPRILLEPDADYQDIWGRARLELFVSTLGWKSQPFNIVGVFREIMNNREVMRGNFDMLDYAKKHDLPRPLLVIRHVIGSYRNTPEIREQLNTWLEGYVTKLSEHEALEDKLSPAAEAILDELTVMVEEIAGEYPELVLAHNSIFASTFTELDPERAKAYFDLAVSYYQEAYEERKILSEINLNHIENSNNQRYRHDTQQLAALYYQLGLPKIGRQYAYRARGEHFKAIW